MANTNEFRSMIYHQVEYYIFDYVKKVPILG